MVKMFILETDQGVVLVSGRRGLPGYWLQCPEPRVALFPTRTRARVIADKLMRNNHVMTTRVLQIETEPRFFV